MNQIHAIAERIVPLPVDRVRAAVTDYAGARARILTPDFTDYEPTPAFTLDGRRHEFAVSTVEDSVVEADRHSSLVFTWTVDGTAETTSVRLSATHDGANGPRGLIQRVTAPPKLQALLTALLDNLAADLGGN